MSPTTTPMPEQDLEHAADRLARPAPPDGDPLCAYRQALRERFPSADEITSAAQARQRRKRRAQAATVAGVAVLALAVWLADPAYRSHLIAAAPGQPVIQMLADGSEVQLDGGSTLDVQWHLRSRRLTLDKGEVLFRVAHGRRTFTVTAGDTRIRDIGTVFDVRRMDAGTRVVVLEGAVEVTAGDVTRRLEANQRVDVPAGGRPSAVYRVDAERATAWRRGKLSFDGVTLAEAVQDMQAHTRRRIVVDDGRAAALRLSAEFDRDQVDAMLPLLPGILPVTVRNAPDGSVHVAMRGTP